MTDLELEIFAIEQFKHVADDGLFPNYTDRDIWVDGFITATKLFIVEKQNENIIIKHKNNL